MLMAVMCVLVARVAYLASDVVLSVQPALQTDSVFSKSLKALKANKTESVAAKGVSEVRDLLYYGMNLRRGLTVWVIGDCRSG